MHTGLMACAEGRAKRQLKPHVAMLTDDIHMCMQSQVHLLYAVYLRNPGVLH
jgi:hypothetical protein